MSKCIKQNLLTLGGLALTTALSTFSMSAKADTPWGDLSGAGFTTDITDVKNTVIDTNVMVAVGTSANLNIRADESVTVNTMTNDGVFVASRVPNNNLSTLIDGALNSNGKIIIQDVNGIIYRDGAAIDVNGLVSTTAATVTVSPDAKSVVLDDFADNGRVVVRDGATISIKDGGLAAFVAPTVINHGIITAKMAKIELAGVNTNTTVDLYGDGLLEIAVDATNEAALIARNSLNGEIVNDGGIIHMTTGFAKDIVDSTINLQGISRADSVTQVGGKIILGGDNTGRVRIEGKAQSRGETGGGNITITAQDVIMTTDAVLNARAFETGNGGTITIDSKNRAVLDGRIRTYGGNTSGDAGNIITSGDNQLVVRNTLEIGATSANGDEGTWSLDTTDLNINGNAASVMNTTLDTGVDIIASGTNDVMVNSALIWTGNASLTLNAANDVLANRSITGDGDISFNAVNSVDIDETVTGNSIAFDAPTVSLNADLVSANLSGNATTVNIESTDAIIQDGVDIAMAGNGTMVNIAAGTYAQSVIVDKALILSGTGRTQTIITPGAGVDGITIDGNIGDFGRVYVRNLGVNGGRNGVVYSDTANANELLIGGSAFTNNSDTGVLIKDTFGADNLNKLNIGYSDFTNNGQKGLAAYGDTTSDANIYNTNFLNNGLNSAGNGDGDVFFFMYNGDVRLADVNIQNNSGNAADYGVQIRGSSVLAESGDLEFENLDISGEYRTASLGVQEFDGIGDLSMTGVSLGGTTDAGNNTNYTELFGAHLLLGNLGSDDLNVGNTAFETGNGSYIINGTQGDIDATTATFEGETGATATLDQNFAIEDKVGHVMDTAGFGLVTWKSDNVFATQLSETLSSGAIQRGIDESNVGGTVNVDNGTFDGDLDVNKSITLSGAQAGIDARNRTGVDETILSLGTGGVEITANDVTMDGFEITDGATGGVTIGATNTDNTVLKNNKIHNVNGDGAGITLTNATNASTTNNSVDGFLNGVQVEGTSSDIEITDNKITNNTDTNTGQGASNYYTGAGVLIGNDVNSVEISGNELDGNTDGIRINRAGTNITIDDNTVDNSIQKGIVINRTNNVEVTNNELDGNKNGIRTFKSDGTIITDNTVDNTRRSAILLAGGGNDIQVIDNEITNAENGVWAQGGDNNIVTSNDIQDFTANGVQVSNSADNTTITNNLIQSTENDATGVKITDATNTNIGGIGNTLSNRIYDADTVIEITDSTGTDIVGNDIRRGQFGILASNAGALDVNNNIIDDTATGIDVTASDGSQMADNTITDASIGIYAKQSDDIVIDDNNITNFSQIALVVSETTDADITDNIIQSTIANANGVGVLDATGTQITDNLIYDADGGIRISGDTGTLINGNDLRRNTVSIATDSNASFASTNLVITDNTIVDSGLAMTVFNTPNVRIGGAGDANTITNSGGLLVSNSDSALIDSNIMTSINGTGINVLGTDMASITNNVLNGTTGNGIIALSGDGTVIDDNMVTGSLQNAITVQKTTNASIINNIVSGTANGAAVLVDGSTDTNVTSNDVGNGNIGIDVRGSVLSPSDDTLILNNMITNNAVGISTLGDTVNLVEIQGNQLDANAIGMLLAGGEIDISNLLAPNLITDGDTAMKFNGENVSLANNSLGSTVFTDQTGNYITLENNALFAPDSPTVIDGLAANYNGIVPLDSILGAGILSAVERLAIEDLMQDFNDDATLGDIIVGLGLDVSEEDLFTLGLYSFSPSAANVNVTFNGLPPVNTPDLSALANISPAAGGDDSSASELANLEPAAGGNDGCWAAVGESSFDGTVSFSFGGNAIKDHSCAQ